MAPASLDDDESETWPYGEPTVALSNGERVLQSTVCLQRSLAAEDYAVSVDGGRRVLRSSPYLHPDVAFGVEINSDEILAILDCGIPA